jgi:tetraacyldisaccharide 4'-kinase
MDQQQLMDILSGQARGLWPATLRLLLTAAELHYSPAMRLRRWAYRRRLLPSFNAGVPVISVGNLTTGGTGKTPMTAWLARHLRQLGRRPAVLMRGYKARQDGHSDEAIMLRLELGRPPGLAPSAALATLSSAIPSEVPVYPNPNRRAAAKEAVAAGADVLILDDGFQHLRLRRDLDIVLIDATNPFGFGRVLPRGLLREPLAALKDADALVITRSEQAEAKAIADLRGRLIRLAPHATFHTAAHRPTRLLDQAGAPRALTELAGKKVLAFCGLGNPQSFFETLKGLGTELVATETFPDHAAYGPRELGQLDRRAAQSGTELLVTTQKDAVKIHTGWLSRPLWKLVIEMKVTQGREELLTRIEGVLRRT